MGIQKHHRLQQARQMQHKLLERIMKHALTGFRRHDPFWKGIRYQIYYGASLRTVLTRPRPDGRQHQRSVCHPRIWLDEAKAIAKDVFDKLSPFSAGGVVVTGRWEGGVRNGSEAIIPKALAEHYTASTPRKETVSVIGRANITINVTGDGAVSVSQPCCGGAHHASADEGSDSTSNPHGEKP